MVLERLAPLFMNPELRKVGQNCKFDMQVLANSGVTVKGVWFDTMLASYVLNPARSGHGLDALAQEHLNHRMISYSEVTGTGKGQKNFSQVEIGAASRYACEDADATWLLRQKFGPALAETGLEKLFHTIEMPLVTILADMENHGVLLDRAMLKELSEDFAARLAELEKQIFVIAGAPFNLNSPKQLGEVLFERMGLKTGKKTKGKTGWSTDNEVLSAMAEEQEIARLILDYRGLTKLKSTYSDALERLICPKTGRVHTSYNQTVTATGRLSSSDPNLQNIPVRTDEGRRIRHAFIAPPGHVILSADYSQIELRVLAHLSGDQVFCHAFANDEDIHTRTAAEVFGLFPEMVTTEMRRQAKTINFGIIYGQGAFSLAKQLGIARKTAEDFIAAYKERHSGAVGFLDSCIRQAEETRYVTTILGRRLPIPDIHSSNGNVRAFAQRNAINYPIQGSAADIIKSAMIRVDARMRAEGLKSRLTMQVHDELVFEIPENELLPMELLVEEEMFRAAEMKVPLRVDISYGKNWCEAH
jgi:DNA polymerase-1